MATSPRVKKTAKRAATKKSATKKSVAKKTATKKSVAKKSVARKTAKRAATRPARSAGTKPGAPAGRRAAGPARTRPPQGVEALVPRLLALEDFRHGRGATEAELTAAERALGVRIRGGYRDFLQRLGWSEHWHLNIWGVGTAPRAVRLVELTRSERTEAYPPIPPELLPFMNDGAGNHYCLDLRAKGDEPPVVFWDHEAEDGPQQKPLREARDFVSWLREQLSDVVE